MIHAEYAFSLPCAPEEAFNFLANPLNDANWQSSCAAVAMTQPGTPPNVGAGYQITFNFLGRKMEFSCEITAREHLKHYAFKVLEGPFYYEGGYHFTPTEQGLDAVWHFDAEPGGFFGILPASLLRKVLISQVERDLVKLKRQLPQLQMA